MQQKEIKKAYSDKKELYGCFLIDTNKCSV